jgi:hypothetical protein
MGKICIIGPRSSGKTTYLAGLAYWPDKQRKSKRSSLFTIQAIGDDAKTLKAKAEDIICQGASLPPTDIGGGIYKAPLYQFQIQFKHFLKKLDEISLFVRDYPGEIFEGLASGVPNPLHEEFIQKSLMKDVEGCLIFLPEWTNGIDDSYSKILERFTELMDREGRLNNLRLAVAMSKCERGELWPGRLEPEIDIFDVHLPKTKETLRAKIPRHNLQFYTVSTFGVLRRNDPRPNRIDIAGKGGRHAVLREPSRWRPYNMLAPLYWLSKG